MCLKYLQRFCFLLTSKYDFFLQFELVCDKLNLASLLTSLFFVGELIGGLIGGNIIDRLIIMLIHILTSILNFSFNSSQ